MPGTTPRGSVHVYPLVHQTTKTGQLRGGLKPLVAAGNAGIIEGPLLFASFSFSVGSTLMAVGQEARVPSTDIFGRTREFIFLLFNGRDDRHAG